MMCPIGMFYRLLGLFNEPKRHNSPFLIYENVGMGFFFHVLLRLKHTKSREKKRFYLLEKNGRSLMLRKRKRPTRPEEKKMDVGVPLPVAARRAAGGLSRRPRRPNQTVRFQTGQRGAEKGAAGGVLLQAARSAGSSRPRHMMQGERRGIGPAGSGCCSCV